MYAIFIFKKELYFWKYLSIKLFRGPLIKLVCWKINNFHYFLYLFYSHNCLNLEDTFFSSAFLWSATVYIFSSVSYRIKDWSLLFLGKTLASLFCLIAQSGLNPLNSMNISKKLVPGLDRWHNLCSQQSLFLFLVS